MFPLLISTARALVIPAQAGMKCPAGTNTHTVIPAQAGIQCPAGKFLSSNSRRPYRALQKLKIFVGDMKGGKDDSGGSLNIIVLLVTPWLVIHITLLSNRNL